MDIQARLQSLRWAVYAPIGKLKYRLRTPSLSSPDIRSLDICWHQIVNDKIYANRNFEMPECGAVIFDVGANVGVYALWASATYRAARIVSFEPNPITYRYLDRNVASIRRSTPGTDFIPINIAVSDREGAELTLYHSPVFCAGSTMMPVGRDFGWEPVRVKSTTVSSRMRQLGVSRVHLLKIDVEGHAGQVLQGVESDDFARIDNIVLECDYLPEGGTPADTLRSMLASHGYETEFDDDKLTNNLTLYAWRRRAA